MNDLSTRLKWFIVAFVVIFLGVFALDLYPGLRGGAGWDWTYQPPESLTPVLIPALVLAVYVVGALALRNRGVAVALVWAVLGGTLIAYAVVGVSAQGDALFHLLTRTLSPVQTGASTLAVSINDTSNLDHALTTWPDIMRESLDRNLIHFTTSPPGQPVVHLALAKLFDAPIFQPFSQTVSMALRPYQCSDLATMRYTNGELVSAGLIAYLMPLFAALTALPLYYAGRALNLSERASIIAAQWWAVVPAVLMFAPVWNTFYPLPVTAAFALLAYGLRNRRMRLVFAAGLLMSFTTFLNFSVLPALLMFGLFTLGYRYFVARHDDNPPALYWPLQIGVWFGLGLLVVWLMYFLASGLTPFDLWRVTTEKHSELVQREYLPWLILHPYDVFLFTGWAASLLAIWAFFRAFFQRTFEVHSVFTLAMGFTVLLVNLAGVVQGENARILIFYMPFLLLMAAPILATHSFEDKSRLWDAPLLVVQTLTVLVMAAVIQAVPLDLNPQVFAPREDIGGLEGFEFKPSGATFESGMFAGRFALDQYRYVADPGAQAITYEFNWRGIERTERPYRFELIARAENPTDGVILSDVFAWYPQAGGYLSTCWREGDLIRDVVVLPLPPVSEPVVWEMVLRGVDDRTGEMLMTPDDSPIGAPILEAVRYP